MTTAGPTWPATSAGLVRPRLFYSDGEGTTAMVTGGAIVEDRRGGTLDGRVAPDGAPFEESLDTARGDLGGIVRWAMPSSRLISVRGSYGRDSQDRIFGDVRERGVRSTGFGEVSLQGAYAEHTWVVGGAYQHDGYTARDLPSVRLLVRRSCRLRAGRVRHAGRFACRSAAGSTCTTSTARSRRRARRCCGGRMRNGRFAISAGGGAFAPTPFVEDTDETGLSRRRAARRARGRARVGRLARRDTASRRARGHRNAVRLDVRNPVQTRSEGDSTASVRARQRGGPDADMSGARCWAATGLAVPRDCHLCVRPVAGAGRGIGHRGARCR